jgi:hypothetical protein
VVKKMQGLKDCTQPLIIVLIGYNKRSDGKFEEPQSCSKEPMVTTVQILVMVSTQENIGLKRCPKSLVANSFEAVGQFPSHMQIPFS